METVDLREVAAAIRRRAPDNPLDRIEAALAVSAELASTADGIIGQFVTEAREAGRSWTEIGARMGVSKQAARQRFGNQPPVPGSPVPGSAGPAGRRRRRRRGMAAAQACSFCGKPRTESLQLVAGPHVYICEECVALCNEIFAGQASSAP